MRQTSPSLLPTSFVGYRWQLGRPFRNEVSSLLVNAASIALRAPRIPNNQIIAPIPYAYARQLPLFSSNPWKFKRRTIVPSSTARGLIKDRLKIVVLIVGKSSKERRIQKEPLPLINHAYRSKMARFSVNSSP